MKKQLFILVLLAIPVLLFSQAGNQPSLPFKMEELSSPKFVAAVEKAAGVCIVPLGIIEKHGPHLPLGTDLFECREVAFTAAMKEYAVVFPPYFIGQIFEAKHQPGTVAYSQELMWEMLEKTCEELARNGLKKIILLNGHGGNTNFLQYFCQTRLDKKEDYTVVLFEQGPDEALDKEIKALEKAKAGGHADEGETSMMYVIRPDLVDLAAINSESGLDQARLKALKYAYAGIWWYASYPNHYACDTAQPNQKLGELIIEKEASQLAELVKFMKSDNSVQRLQDEFFKRTENPLQK